MLATKKPTIQKNVDILKKLSSDQKTQIIYDAREKARMDELSRLRGSYTKGKQEGIEEGIEKGIDKGREEEKIAMVKRLLAERIDVEIIAKTSGLPLEKVRELITPQG